MKMIVLSNNSSKPAQNDTSAPILPNGKPRLTHPVWGYYKIVTQCLDDLIPEEHLVRDIWEYVKNLDLSIVLGKIQSVEGGAGRPAIDPQIFLTLWIYATVKGIGSSRVIDELCKNHNVYKWICGEVSVNYHSISDFCTKHGDQLNSLLTQSVAILATAGSISLEKVAQDGLRVRAHAGESSFRRKHTLQENLYLAKLLVDDLKLESEKNPAGCKTRQLAAEQHG